VRFSVGCEAPEERSTRRTSDIPWRSALKKIGLRSADWGSNRGVTASRASKRGGGGVERKFRERKIQKSPVLTETRGGPGKGNENEEGNVKGRVIVMVRVGKKKKVRNRKRTTRRAGADRDVGVEVLGGGQRREAGQRGGGQRRDICSKSPKGQRVPRGGGGKTSQKRK